MKIVSLMCMGVPALCFTASAKAASDTTDSTTLTEIVVTAQKREQSIQDVAGSVSALGTRDIQDLGLDDVRQLQFLVPSLQAGISNGFTQLTIRGVGMSLLDASVQPGVASYIDGVYQARTGMDTLGQIDLARIEVLRGPQGTLYGRNALGGVVNFITAAPTADFGGSVLAGYANYDEYHLQAVLNAPLSDRIRTRLVVDYDNRLDGFEHNVVFSNLDADKGATLSGRLKVDIDLASTAGLEISLFNLNRAGAFPYAALSGPPSADSVAANPVLAGAIVPSTPHYFSVDYPSNSSTHAYGGSGTLNWDMGFGKLRSITSFQRYLYTDSYDTDGTNVPFTPTQDNISSSTTTQEFDLSGSARELDWLVGLFYLNDTLHQSEPFQFPSGLNVGGGAAIVPGGFLLTQNDPFNTTSWAIFSDETAHLTDKFSLIAGARYSEEWQKNLQTNTLGPLNVEGFGVIPVVVSCQDQDVSQKFTSFTPRGGLQYDIDPTANAYFTVSRGYKSGGINETVCGNTYLPETLTSYEAGMRTEFLDRHLILNPTIYYYDYHNYQVTEIESLSSPVINAPKASVKGFELETDLNANSNVTFSANLSLMDARYGSGFTNIDVLNPEVGPQNLDGHYLNRSPKESGNLGAQYQTDPLAIGKITARVDLYLSSRIYFREFNSLADSQAGYRVLNLNLIWGSVGGRYSARLYATNLNDSSYFAYMGAASILGSRYVTWGPPRQIGGEVRANF